MSVEQVHQRLGVAEGVSRALQDPLQRVTTGHQASHEAPQSLQQEINVFRSENRYEATYQVDGAEEFCCQIGSGRGAVRVGEAGGT